MVRAACHCTAVRLEIAELPDWVLDCNCTLCRRYGAIWAYPAAGTVKVVAGEDATETYLWGDRMIAFHRCAACGSVTHFTGEGTSPPHVYGVNTRMIPTLDPASVRLLQIDNGHTGFFWTKSANPPLPSKHPKLERPGPDDWR